MSDTSHEWRADEYLYVQLADLIAEQIRAGKLKPGARLPSEIDLAEEYGVARLTARRAVRELVTRGLARTLPGKGSFVAAKIPPPADAEG